MWDAVWEWLLTGENLFWVIMTPFLIRFVWKDLPELIWIWKKTPSGGDNDPSGNDNINRNHYDYM